MTLLYTHMHAEYILTQWIKTSKDFFKKYTTHFIWKVCEWEGVGDRTELQNIDPHSYDHLRCVFFCSPGLLNRRSGGPLCWVRAFSTASSHQRVSKLTDFLSSPSYIIFQPPPSSCGRHKLHSFNPSTVKVIISWSTGCTCYLYRFISYFDSPAGS